MNLCFSVRMLDKWRVFIHDNIKMEDGKIVNDEIRNPNDKQKKDE